jgi:2-keto-4-pentenoate hydratase/2-oxohepta-3-ene-1,7-dioic acid hydratase in catechol pathway
VKLISFSISGETRFGVVDGERVLDLTARLGSRYRSIVDYIAAPATADVAALLAQGASDHALGDVKLLPVVPNPGKIVCVGLNYEEHKQEGVRNPADKPMLFARWPETLIAHGDPLIQPRISQMLDFEAEMLVVIGKETGRYLPAADAMDKVFGYSCMNESSVRDWQRHSSQVTAGKNFVGTGAVGPWIVTADEFGGAAPAVEMTLRLNGAVMQHTNTADMIWGIAETIAYISNWIPLHPGDLIATGTPAGVGSRRTPPVFLRPGDVVEVTIERIGTLRNVVRAE